MVAYLMAQLSALLGAAEGIKTKSVLQHYHTSEHIFYKNMTLFFFSLLFGILQWQIGFYGLLFVLYSVVIVFFNENWRSKAMQHLEINTFSLLITFSVLSIYGVELFIGREEATNQAIIGILLFISAFYLFLDVKLSDFFNLNKRALLNVLGVLLIATIDRPIAKTVFDNGWISPETAIFLRIFILIFIFYLFLKKNSKSIKGNMKKGLAAHRLIGLFKYSREILYSYALIFGSVLTVTLAMNTGLFLTFILSGFFFKESKWSIKKGIAILIAIVGIMLVSTNKLISFI